MSLEAPIRDFAAAASSRRSCESLCITLVGGIVRCIAVVPAMTFSRLHFAFRETPDLLTLGLGFAMLIGVVGWRAARHPRRAREGGDDAVFPLGATEDRGDACY